MDGCSSCEHSYGSAGGLHEEQDVVVSLQLQQQLKQIYMLMDTEEYGFAEAVPTSSSSTFPSFSGSTTTPTSSHQPVEVSSLQIPLSPVAYDEDCHGLFYGNFDTIVDLDDLMTPKPHQEQAAQSKNGHEFGGAFRPYVRHLSPRKKPQPGACGQRAIKDAMSALARMHMARFAQLQSYQMKMAAPPSSVGSNANQIQHVLSERKRREKLNDSFKALRTVLPPGKKDRASTLFRARDYVNTLKSRVSELEEANRMLVESQSQFRGENGSEQEDYPGEVDNSDTAAAEETSKEFRLNIVVGSGWSAMDGAVTILQSLKEIGDVRLVAMDTGSSSSGLPPGKDYQMATITLQVTSSRRDESLLKESVIKTVKDAMKLETIVTI